MDDFLDSVPDGMTNALMRYDPKIFPSNEQSYNVLVDTFGTKVNGESLESATDKDLEKLVSEISSEFELSYMPSVSDAKQIIQEALNQWRGGSS